MNHNLSQFREIIEDCVDEKESTFQQREKLKAVLEILPEEETDHVKAYQSLMFLVDYLEGREYDDPDPIRQLLRLRGDIREDALEDIFERIEIENTTGAAFPVHSAQIHDPVSKVHQRITNEQQQHDLVEQNVEYMARDILEAPL